MGDTAKGKLRYKYYRKIKKNLKTNLIRLNTRKESEKR